MKGEKFKNMEYASTSPSGENVSILLDSDAMIEIMQLALFSHYSNCFLNPFILFYLTLVFHLIFHFCIFLNCFLSRINLGNIPCLSTSLNMIPQGMSLDMIPWMVGMFPSWDMSPGFHGACSLLIGIEMQTYICNIARV